MDINKGLEKLIKYREEILQELNSLDHVIECSYKNYSFIVKFVKEKKYRIVIDIGCSFGHQAALFDNDLVYIGIDEDKVNFYKGHFKSEFLVRKYPEEKIPDYLKVKETLPISNLALGWNCYVDEEGAEKQFKQLSEDFGCCLLYLPIERGELLKKYFKNVEVVKESQGNLVKSAFFYCYN